MTRPVMKKTPAGKRRPSTAKAKPAPEPVDTNVIVMRLKGHVRIYGHLLRAHTRDTLHIKSIERLMGQIPDGEFIAKTASRPIIQAREAIATPLKQEDRLIKNDARLLPVWQWVKTIRGAGAGNLGLIIGNTGDLSNYANPAKVWKRMGLGLLPDGQRQRKFTDPDLAALAGFSPQRRAIMHVLGDCLIKGNRDGEFKALYDARKQYELERNPELQRIVAHKRASRYMQKRFLRDLWRAWRRYAGIADDGSTAGGTTTIPAGAKGTSETSPAKSVNVDKMN